MVKKAHTKFFLNQTGNGPNILIFAAKPKDEANSCSLIRSNGECFYNSSLAVQETLNNQHLMPSLFFFPFNGFSY